MHLLSLMLSAGGSAAYVRFGKGCAFAVFSSDGSLLNRPGSGLGLAIVAEIAAAHGGAAVAVAAAPHGLRVTVSLPARRDHAGQAVAALAAQRSWR